MKTLRFLLTALAAAAALSSCACGDGTSCVAGGPSGYTSRTYCDCASRACTPVRVQTWNNRYVSRYPSTWGRPTTVTQTVTTTYGYPYGPTVCR